MNIRTLLLAMACITASPKSIGFFDQYINIEIKDIKTAIAIAASIGIGACFGKMLANVEMEDIDNKDIIVHAKHNQKHINFNRWFGYSVLRNASIYVLLMLLYGNDYNKYMINIGRLTNMTNIARFTDWLVYLSI
ncbi:MAG TPA: hypothetical protein VGW78_05550 [Candidatus Babeliales bacterium]|jgi:hypothetical protein|nr:hypothetical protein [Candidatus Babeliales bacterium]